MVLSVVPVDQVLQLLHGFWFTVSATGQYLPAIIYPDDTVCCVYEETAVHKAGHKSKREQLVKVQLETITDIGDIAQGEKRGRESNQTRVSVLTEAIHLCWAHRYASCWFSPAFACKFNGFDSSGVACACCYPERRHELLSIRV